MRIVAGPLFCLAFALLAAASQEKEEKERNLWKRFLSQRTSKFDEAAPVEGQQQFQQDLGSVAEDREAILAERDDLRAQLTTKNQEFLAQHRRADHLALEVLSLRSEVRATEAKEGHLEAKLKLVRADLSRGLSDAGVETASSVQSVSRTDDDDAKQGKTAQEHAKTRNLVKGTATPLTVSTFGGETNVKRTVHLHAVAVEGDSVGTPRGTKVPKGSHHHGASPLRAARNYAMSRKAANSTVTSGASDFQQVEAQLQDEDAKIDLLSSDEQDDDSTAEDDKSKEESEESF